MNNVTYYSIQLQLSGQAPLKLNYQEQKNQLFLSANGALAGVGKQAYLDSPELSAQFIEAYMPRLQKRYGADVRVIIVQITSSGYVDRTTARIIKDSELARKRLKTGILASNRKP